MSTSQRTRPLSLVSLLTLSLLAAPSSGQADEALERTRKQLRMLDDLYKTAVVLITTHYINGAADLPSASAAMALFDAMKEKGWHEVRLFDVTGNPLVARNIAKDAFEEKAVDELRAGKAYYEQIEERDGARYLRAATPIPVLLEKCTMCHPGYQRRKAGEAIGALSYTMLIE